MKRITIMLLAAVLLCGMLAPSFSALAESPKQKKATVILYMCGADLESQNGMATSDLKEMVNADLSDKVNLLVYTGGAKKWKNKVLHLTISSQ